MFGLLHLLNVHENYDTSIAFYLDATADEIVSYDWQSHIKKTLQGNWEIMDVRAVKIPLY